MKKRTINIIVILLTAIILIALNQLELLEKSAKFMLIPIVAFYYFGQYSERKFK
jgi:tryptophan-rich sensory protein